MVFIHDAGQVTDYIAASAGVYEIGSTNLNRCCARKQHFYNILRRAHAAHAYNRDFDRLRNLIHHAQRDREHGRPGKAAGNIGKHRLSGVKVIAQSEQRIDEADSVRPGILTGFCNGDNVRNIRERAL